MRHKAMPMLLVPVIMIGLGFLMGRTPSRPSGQVQEPTETLFIPTPSTWGEPITNANQALQSALIMLPHGRSPDSYIVKLVSAGTLRSLHLGLVPFDGNDNSPLWVVALRGDNLVDIALAGTPSVNTSQIPIYGTIYVFDANTGLDTLVTTMTDVSDYDSLGTLQGEPIPITTATTSAQP